MFLLSYIDAAPEYASFKDSQGKMLMHILCENYSDNYFRRVKNSTLGHIASDLYKRSLESVNASVDLVNCAIAFILLVQELILLSIIYFKGLLLATTHWKGKASIPQKQKLFAQIKSKTQDQALHEHEFSTNTYFYYVDWWQHFLCLNDDRENLD